MDDAPGPAAAPPASGARELSARLNWLRAAVLGANDGIISTAGLVIGVAAATTSARAIATAGLAGMVAGAFSMAVGEYVSVSTQRDAQRSMIRTERSELERWPETELRELVGMLRQRGLRPATAREVARELTAHDALGAHLELELGLDRDASVSPWSAAGFSAVAFVAGALLPLIAILVPPAGARIGVAVAGVLVGLALTGTVSAHLSAAPKGPAVARLLIGGGLAMVATYVIGEALDVTVT